MDQNKNIYPQSDSPASDPDGFADGRPETTLRLTRGVARLMRHQGDAVLTEMTLANGRRADVVALSPKGKITIVEIKSCQADFDVDAKWPEYLDFCDEFYFAVDTEFPQERLPETEGLIIADGFGGAIIRPSADRSLAAARRKAVTLRFARIAAGRLYGSADAHTANEDPNGSAENNRNNGTGTSKERHDIYPKQTG